MMLFWPKNTIRAGISQYILRVVALAEPTFQDSSRTKAGITTETCCGCGRGKGRTGRLSE